MLFRAWIFNNLQPYIGNKLSKDTGFSISSAERYSLALFELSEENNLLGQIEEQSLSVLNLIDQSKDFFHLIKDPTTSHEDLLKIINKIAESNKFDNLFRESMVLELLWENKIDYIIDNRIKNLDQKKITFPSLIKKYFSKFIRKSFSRN